MKVKHTPGPWSHNKDGCKGQVEVGNYILDVWETAETAEEYEANATLIAAAPEMLDALISIDERLKKCEDFPISEHEAIDSFYKEIIEEAIKKATS